MSTFEIPGLRVDMIALGLFLVRQVVFAGLWIRNRCCPRPYRRTVVRTPTPWVFLGYTPAPGAEPIDLTTAIQPHLEPGLIVRPQDVREWFPEVGDADIQYLDAMSFEVKTLSSDGLVIDAPADGTDVPAGGGVGAATGEAGTGGVDGVAPAAE